MIPKLRQKAKNLLLWSQKHTKTDMLYLAKGGFWLTFAQGVSSLASFALSIIFANFISPETYGDYKYILSIAGLFSIFSLPGMSTAVARAAAKNQESVIPYATATRIKYSLLGTAIALVVSSYYFYLGNLTLSIALLLIGVTLPIFDTFSLYLSYYVGKRRFDIQSKQVAISAIISAASVATTIVLTDKLIWLLVSYFIPLILVRFFFYIKLKRRLPDMPNKEEGMATVNYGLHLTFMKVLSTIASNIDKILIWRLLGPVEVSIYIFAIALPEQIKAILKGMGDLAFPKLAAITPEQLKLAMPSLYKKMALYAMAIICISIFYIFLSPQIYFYLFPKYQESIVYSQIFSLSLVASVLFIPLAIMSAQKMVKEQYLFNTLQPIAQSALFVILIPLYGLWGSIAAWMISRLFSLILAFALILNRRSSN